MRGTKVISGKNLPMRPPIGWSILSWLVLDRLHAPGWAWGILGTLLAIHWIVAIREMYTQEPVELKELQSPSAKKPGDGQ